MFNQFFVSHGRIGTAAMLLLAALAAGRAEAAKSDGGDGGGYRPQVSAPASKYKLSTCNSMSITRRSAFEMTHSSPLTIRSA